MTPRHRSTPHTRRRISHIVTATLLSVLVPAMVLQAQVPQSPNKLNDKGERVGPWTVLFDTDWKTVTKPEEAAYYRVVTYKDGKPDGITRDYYLSGKLQGEGLLISEDPDICEGEYKAYFESGKLQQKWVMRNGMRQDTLIEWYESGQRKSIFPFKDDKREGVAIGWYEKGPKQFETPFSGDKENGIAKGWFDNGQRRYEVSLKDGKRDGASKMWDLNGKETVTQFKNGEEVKK